MVQVAWFSCCSSGSNTATYLLLEIHHQKCTGGLFDEIHLSLCDLCRLPTGKERTNKANISEHKRTQANTSERKLTNRAMSSVNFCRNKNWQTTVAGEREGKWREGEQRVAQLLNWSRRLAFQKKIHVCRQIRERERWLWRPEAAKNCWHYKRSLRIEADVLRRFRGETAVHSLSNTDWRSLKRFCSFAWLTQTLPKFDEIV